MAAPIDQDPLEIPVGDKGDNSKEKETNVTGTGADAHPIDIDSQLTMECIAAHQMVILESKGNIQSSNNIVRHVAAKKFDQVGSIESASVEKVLNAGK